MVFALTAVSTAAFAEDILITVTVDEPAPPCFDTTYPATFSTSYIDPNPIAPGDTANSSIGISTTFGQDEDCVSVYPTNFTVNHSGWTDLATNPVSGLALKVACDFETTVDIGAGLTCGPNISVVSFDVVTDANLAAAVYYDTITITLVP